MPHRAGMRPGPAPETGALTVPVRGELDDAGGQELIAVVVAHLGSPEPPPAVRLDFRELEGVDPLGLAALLMIHRHTSAAGAVLRLDNRPRSLERLLRQTNVLDHLTAAEAGRTGPGG
ncbi:STAS domain-containing protein [Streptomyces toyocaensis]|uniref:STAS domain-containing protein n=1 Tax=Streptomyces toyocaensis TaxID=55952 RepID=UPI001F449040|nr:STAS domain-containing protein [Streptomyces toyocaensis]